MSKLHRFIEQFPIEPALIALTLAVYWRAQHCWFVYDDAQYAFAAKHIRHGLNLADIAWAFTSRFAANWHPLTWISYMVDTQFFGFSPRAFHLTNVLLHAASTLVLFVTLSRLTKSAWKSAFVAAVFAVHPLHVESVAWIAERKDVLSGFFFMLTIWAYARYAKSPGIKRYLAVVGLYALGLMSKPMLVTLPFVLLLLDYWPLGRLVTADNRVRSVVEKIPLLAMSVASCVVTYVIQSTGGAFGEQSHYPFAVRLMNALVSYVTYMGKTIWPTKLAVLYPHPGPSLPVWKAVVAGTLLVAITILVFRSTRAKPYLAVGWLWFLGTLVPVIGLVQVGVQAMADRYMYLPMIGLTIMIAWGLRGNTKARESEGVGASDSPAPPLAQSPILPIVSVLLVLALSVRTWHQIGYWQDNATLFRHAAAVTENNVEAYINLGAALVGTEKYDEALEIYTKAERISPNRSAIHYNLGGVYTPLGRFDEAIAEYKKAIKLDPSCADAHNNLGLVYAKLGRFGDAEAEYRTAIKLAPKYAQAHSNLGSLYDTMGRTEDALGQYDEAIEADPECTDAHYNKGVALQKLGRLDEAAEEYRETIRLKPEYVSAHKNLATTLYFLGDYDAAWAEVHEVIRQGGEVHPGFLSALSQAMPDPY